MDSDASACGHDDGEQVACWRVCQASVALHSPRCAVSSGAAESSSNCPSAQVPSLRRRARGALPTHSFVRVCACSSDALSVSYLFWLYYSVSLPCALFFSFLSSPRSLCAQFSECFDSDVYVRFKGAMSKLRGPGRQESLLHRVLLAFSGGERR